MPRYTDLIGRTVGVIIDADTAMADWTPPVAGRLKRIRVIVGGIAATSLVENGYIKLSSATFGGVDQYAPFQGVGLETVPRSEKREWITECDLKVNNAAIKVFYYHNVIPVTPEITVFGDIET